MRLTSLFLSLTLVTLCGTARSAEKPNVIFLLADDLGWSDTTLYGTTKLYETPNIERLAQRGMTFTRAYSASPLSARPSPGWDSRRRRSRSLTAAICSRR